MRLDDVLQRQAGLVTLEQAAACGISRDAVWRRGRSGAWRRVGPGVYLVSGHRVTDEVRVRAAWLWARPGSLVSGAAAASWHGMGGPGPGPVELTVPPGASPRCPAGVRIRRRAIAAPDRVRLRGITLTSRARTALDVAACSPGGSSFLDRALQQHVQFPAVYRAYCRMLGTPGSAEVGRLLVAAADRADSAAERLLVRLLRAAGIDGWTLGLGFGGFVLDFAFPAERVAVEVDGWAWHVDVERFQADRRKGNALVRAGWDLLRYTWHDLSGAPEEVVAEIRAATRR